MTGPILETVEAPVIVMRPPSPRPLVMVGVTLESMLGAKVVMGVSVQGYCFGAHLEPETALEMANKLRDAALDLMAMRARS